MHIASACMVAAYCHLQHLQGGRERDEVDNEPIASIAPRSLEAQQPNLLEAAYNVTRVQELLARQKEQVGNLHLGVGKVLRDLLRDLLRDIASIPPCSACVVYMHMQVAADLEAEQRELAARAAAREV